MNLDLSVEPAKDWGFLVKFNNMVCCQTSTNDEAKAMMSYGLKVLVASGALPADVGMKLILENELPV